MRNKKAKALRAVARRQATARGRMGWGKSGGMMHADGSYRRIYLDLKRGRER